jgi:hypothetical protein
MHFIPLSLFHTSDAHAVAPSRTVALGFEEPKLVPVTVRIAMPEVGPFGVAVYEVTGAS